MADVQETKVGRPTSKDIINFVRMMSNDIHKRFDANDEKWDKRLNDVSDSQKQINKHCDDIIEKMKDRTESGKEMQINVMRTNTLD